VSDRVVIEADGGSRANPGPAGYGAVVFDQVSGTVLAERSEFIGVATNNVAEYRALIAGLSAARDLRARFVHVRMDSNLVIQQMKGSWQIKNVGLRPLAREATSLGSLFDEITFEWIPRAQNAHADRLANQAMDRGLGNTPSARTPSRAARPSADNPVTAPAAMLPAGPVAPLWAPPLGQPTRLVLIRHGSTEHSADRRFSGRNDLPLDPAGEAQAAALARRAPSWGHVAAIFSSPLRRARQTADAVAAALRLPVSVTDDLAELDFGSWEGLTHAEVRERDPDELAAWYASPDVATPGGESLTALTRRVRRARNAVIAAHPGQVVAVVTHVSPIKALVRLALDAPPSSVYRLHLDTASVSVLDYFADGVSSLRLFNDISHLER
jgi:broad specificity phosphatase PhoE/ribonuclease HI